MDADLAELDDWLETLEELQSGLNDARIEDTISRKSPGYLIRGNDIEKFPVNMGCPTQQDGGLFPVVVREKRPGVTAGQQAAQSIRLSFNANDPSAMNDLNCLLQQLDIVETDLHSHDEKSMDDYIRRVSLSSSTTDKTPEPTSSPLPDSSTLSVHSFDSGIQESSLSPLADSGRGPRKLSGSSDIAWRPFMGACGRRGFLTDGESHSSTPDGASVSTEDCDMDALIEENSELQEKINHAAKRAEQMNLKKIVIRVFSTDRTTKAVMVDEQMTVGNACKMLTEKNFLKPSPKLALVEKVPNLKMERCLEDHEILADCVLSWPELSKNMMFFEERDDKYGLFEDPKSWIGEDYSCNRGPLDQATIQDIFGGAEPTLPDWKDYLYIKKPKEKSWARKFCIVRNSGLYASKKKKSTSPSDLIRIVVFDANFHLYVTAGGWTKMKAPTPYGFALKPYSAQDRHSKFVLYFCANDEAALRRWCTNIRIAKCGQQLLSNYEGAVTRIDEPSFDDASSLNNSFSSHRKASLDTFPSDRSWSSSGRYHSLDRRCSLQSPTRSQPSPSLSSRGLPMATSRRPLRPHVEGSVS